MKSKNNLKGKYVASIGVAVLLLIATILTVNFLQQSSQPVAINQQAVDSEQSIETKDHITYTAVTEGSALAQLQAINKSVEIKESELGKYVNSINGMIGGADGKYWTFYIDGEMATVGADSYQPVGGELIEWKFQAL